MVAFEDETGEDTERAMELACRNLDKFKWLDDDLPFYFNQVESRMSAAGVRKQWTKFTVLHTVIPSNILTEVKSIVRKSEGDFPDRLPYKALKKEIIRIFGPRKETGMERALSRTLGSGKPSQLARQIIEDICASNLSCDYCLGSILAVWKKSLPPSVIAAIAGRDFTKANLDTILELADDVFASSRPSGASVAAISAVKDRAGTDGASAQVSSPKPAQDPDQGGTLAQQIAAIQKELKSFRGSRSGKGIQQANTGGRGGGKSGHGGRGASMSAAARSRGPRHADGPPNQACKQHWTWGKSSYFCSDPLTCPWKDFIQQRPQ